jgi:hypothetical protein
MKITDYVALTAVAPDDMLPVVDISDTSMAVTGTTKKTTVSVLLSTVKPSGDVSGVTDQANIQALITAGTPVSLQPGLYRINTPLTLANGTVINGVSGGGFGGAFPPGISQITLANGSNCSMVVAPAGVNYWRLSNILLSANGANQSGPAQTGSTGAAIHVADGGSPTELQAELTGVYVEDSYNDSLYIGLNRRMLRARWCKFNNAGLNGSTVYGAGNGITCGYSDHVFETCSIGNSRHHGIYLAPGNAASIRITNCDLFTCGQDWLSVTPTTVAVGSNGQAVSGLTAAGVLNVASTAGFPSSASLFLNVPTGPVVVSYTGTSGGNQFTGVVVSATQGNQGGTLATGQGVYLLGGDAIHIGNSSTGIWIAGNSLDRNQGCGVFAETSLQSVNIAGNRFSSNSAIADGLLPHIMITSPGLRVALATNGMEPLASGFTNRCVYFVQGNGSGSWFDIANSWVSSALSAGKYTNNFPGINPFSNGSFLAQSSNISAITAALKLLGAQTADLLQFQNSSGTPLAAVTAGGALQLGNGAAVGGRLWSGSGAPSIAASVAGDFYFRTDTPGTSLQRIYVATGVNTWTGIV